jgi:hypothetical protein
MDSPPIVDRITKIEMTDPTLQGVKQEDRVLVRNVIYLLQTCKHPGRLCVTWNVASTRDGYTVTGFMDPAKDFEVFKEDLDTIAIADPLRIQSIAIRKSGETPQIVIRVLSMSEPIMLTEMNIITVQKRRRVV